MKNSIYNRSIGITGSSFRNILISGDDNCVTVIYQTTEQEDTFTTRETSIKEASIKVGPNPYKELAAFREKDADLYFGREVLIQELRKRFQILIDQSGRNNAAPRFLTILGPSGCGKSSLVRAGLIPELVRQPLPSKEKILVVVLVPGDSPLKSLALVLARLTQHDCVPEVERMRSYEKGLRESAVSDKFDFLQDVVETLPDIQSTQLIILVDQFERIYSPHIDISDRNTFIDNLLFASNNSANYVTVVITLRSDFIEETQENISLNRLICSKQHVVMVPTMNEEELRSAIAEPAKQAGYPLDEAIIDLLVRDTEGRKGVLPLLQFTLTRIWQGLNKGISPIETYRKINGVGGALAGKAQEIYENLFTETERNIARRLFLGLVQFQVETEARYTRRWRRIEDLIASQDKSETVKQVIGLFSSPGARLITLFDYEGYETVEITHEALIREWGLLKEWIKQDKAFLAWKEKIHTRINEWQKHKYQEELLRGRALLEAKNWSSNRSNDLTKIEKKYIQASERNQSQVKRIRETILVIGIIITSTLASSTAISWRRAESRRITAEIENLVSSADSLFTSHKGLDNLLESIKAGKQLNKKMTWPSSFFSNIEYINQIQVLTELQKSIYGLVEINRLDGHHRFGVNSVAFSSDGKRVVSGDIYGLVQVWNSDGSPIKRLVKRNDHALNRVYDLKFYSDGKIISVHSNGEIRIWGNDYKLLKTMVHPNIWSISTMPDETLLISSGKDGSIYFWNRDGQRILTNQIISGTLVSVSPDGRTLAIANKNNSIDIWKVLSYDDFHIDIHKIQKPESALEDRGKSWKHEALIKSIHHSPVNGDRIVTAGQDGVIKIWNSFGVLLREAEEKHVGEVKDVKFSPDGNFIVSAGADNTIKIWNIEGELLKTFRGHTDSVNSLSFENDGRIIVSGSTDNTVRFWDFFGERGAIINIGDGKITKSDISFDGKYIAVIQEVKAGRLFEKSLKIIDLDGNILEELPQEIHQEIDKVRFSYNSSEIFLLTQDNSIILWNWQSKSKSLKVFNGHKVRISDIDFTTSLDEKQVFVSADEDGVIKIWDIAKEELIYTLLTRKQLTDISISSDGQMIATSNRNGFVDVWSIDGEHIASHQNHSDSVLSVDFSPNRQNLVSASRDSTIRIWNLDDKSQIVLKGHVMPVSVVKYEPLQGHFIASAGDDGTVKFWNINGELIQTLRRSTEYPINSLGFSNDTQKILISTGQDLITWSFNPLELNNFLKNGCMQLSGYLKVNPLVGSTDKKICDDLSNFDHPKPKM
ncbi:WD40 repeat-containing protein [Leptolyngbya sp. PCC 7375]|nr:WD40 repeat-containing protein [Leptolyngbya sp. PCC 7375]